VDENENGRSRSGNGGWTGLRERQWLGVDVEYCTVHHSLWLSVASWLTHALSLRDWLHRDPQINVRRQRGRCRYRRVVRRVRESEAAAPMSGRCRTAGGTDRNVSPRWPRRTRWTRWTRRPANETDDVTTHDGKTAIGRSRRGGWPSATRDARTDVADWLDVRWGVHRGRRHRGRDECAVKEGAPACRWAMISGRK